MKKEYISFGLIGIIAGLVIGFFVGNALYPGTGAATQTVGTGTGGVSVNSSGANQQQLPPNHPTIEPGKTMPAPPLPPGTADAPVGETASPAAGDTSSTAASAAGGVALPSLD